MGGDWWQSPFFAPARPWPPAAKGAITSLRLLAVLNVGFKYARMFTKLGAERHAPCTDGLLAHFAWPRGEKAG